MTTLEKLKFVVSVMDRARAEILQHQCSGDTDLYNFFDEDNRAEHRTLQRAKELRTRYFRQYIKGE